MISIFLILIVFLTGYSYSQVDLNLTLFKNPNYLQIQGFLTQLGYFNRPVSAMLYGIIVLSLIAVYLSLIHRSSKYSWKQIAIGICFVGLVGLFAYPAFSYDFFNYLFDARIVTSYGQNPYFYKPLDFAGDPWLRFMHWVHRTYPYGPGWLILTVLLNFLGWGKLVATIFLYKVFFVGNYFLATFLVFKIAKKLEFKEIKKIVFLFAMNPLVIIEGVISPHLDAVMATILLFAFWQFANQKKLASFLSVILSGSIKFVTWAIIPVFLFPMSWKKWIRISMVLMVLALVPVVATRELYPWYLLPILSLAIFEKNSTVRGTVIALSVGLALSYLSFLYIGDYRWEVQMAKIVLSVCPVLGFVLFTFLKKLYAKSS